MVSAFQVQSMNNDDAALTENLPDNGWLNFHEKELLKKISHTLKFYFIMSRAGCTIEINIL
jgi:imidazoleglycerol phosphate synthase glutamine amidotransferase subunit HisH